MKKRENLKRIIIVLFVFLCTAVFTFMYLLTSRDNRYTRNLDLGNKYLLSEDYDGAIRAFTKAIEIDEKKEDAYIGRGDAYKAKGDYANAWEDYEKAEELSGDTNLIRDKIGATEIAVVDANGQGIDGANVELKGDSHSYEFVTDDTGRIAEPIYPEKYKVKVVKDEYEPVETELSAEEGGFVADPIKLGSGVGAEQGAIPEVYKEAVFDFDKLMREGQKSYREKNKDTYEEEDRDTYYAIVDIDGNGVDELILRFDHQDGKHLTNKDSGYGESTYIYTVKDGKAVNVLVPESSSQGFTPDFVHLGFTKIYKGTNLINRGFEHLPMDDAFYSYQDGVLSETPVAELTRGGGTWLINGETKTEEECEEAYNRLSNGDEGYELQLYEGETDEQEQPDNKEVLIEEYKEFIKSQNDGSKYLNYLIYDIDKDGYPEVMIERVHTDVRGSNYDLYTYESGSFSFVGTIDSLYPHGPGEFASYPNGNGMVSACTFKQFESIEIVALNNGKIETEEVYGQKIEYGADWKYYRDRFDQTYQDSQAYRAYINHQYYRSESSSPYYEGSYLLAQSSMDDFTAVYEALGVEEEPGVSTEEGSGTFMGISVLDQGVERNISANGSTYQIRYDSTEKTDEYVGLNLYINGSSESYRLDAVYYPTIESVYVTDIAVDDSYCNLVVVIGGEDDDSATYILSFKDNEISMVTNFIGRLVPETVRGNGTLLLEYGIGMGIRNYGSFRIRPEISVHNLSAELKELHSGRGTSSEGGTIFEEGYKVPLTSDLTVYGDRSCDSIVGTIPAGESVICEYANYVKFGSSFYVTGREVKGYVTSDMLKSSCDDIFFVG